MRLGFLSRVFVLALVVTAFLTCPVSAAVTFGDASPTKSNVNTDFIPGTGNFENQFTIDTGAGGERAFLKGRNRVSGLPISQSGNVYTVLNGVVSPGPNQRAAWNFDFQFSPIAGKVVSDYFYEIQADTNPAAFFAANNRFDYNTYIVPDLDGHFWEWRGVQDWNGMRAAGQEVNGIVKTP